MKKIIFILMSLLIISSASMAQDAQKKQTGKPPVVKAGQKPEQTKANAAKPGPKLKKDGTPDMRYKENKEAAKKKPEGPKKKDGTPDMRHKVNKDAAKKTNTAK